jgi:hypothetical protein
MSEWPYNTRRWERVRRQKMMESPLCEVCLRQFVEVVPRRWLTIAFQSRKKVGQSARLQRRFRPSTSWRLYAPVITTRKPAPNNVARITCGKVAIFVVVRMIRIIRGIKGRRCFSSRRPARSWTKTDRPPGIARRQIAAQGCVGAHALTDDLNSAR